MEGPSRGAGRHRLAEVPMFARLPPVVLDELARESRVRRFRAGQVLWSEGDPGDALLVLEEGQLRITRVTGGGADVVLSIVDAPAALGELALLDGEPRSASVIAQRPVAVRFIPRSAFLNLLRREPAAVEGVLKSLAAMMRAANERHATIVGLDVPGRLAAWLLTRAVPQGPRGQLGVPLDRSQSELAAELGTTRSTLNRALKGFEGLGLIRVAGDTIVIPDKEGLKFYVDEPGDPF